MRDNVRDYNPDLHYCHDITDHDHDPDHDHDSHIHPHSYGPVGRAVLR